jgi:hypothetical protein
LAWRRASAAASCRPRGSASPPAPRRVYGDGPAGSASAATPIGDAVTDEVGPVERGLRRMRANSSPPMRERVVADARVAQDAADRAQRVVAAPWPQSS